MSKREWDSNSSWLLVWYRIAWTCSLKAYRDSAHLGQGRRWHANRGRAHLMFEKTRITFERSSWTIHPGAHRWGLGHWTRSWGPDSWTCCCGRRRVRTRLGSRHDWSHPVDLRWKLTRLEKRRILLFRFFEADCGNKQIRSHCFRHSFQLGSPIEAVRLAMTSNLGRRDKRVTRDKFGHCYSRQIYFKPQTIWHL